jgi:hypothetical protein
VKARDGNVPDRPAPARIRIAEGLTQDPRRSQEGVVLARRSAPSRRRRQQKQSEAISQTTKPAVGVLGSLGESRMNGPYKPPGTAGRIPVHEAWSISRVERQPASLRSRWKRRRRLVEDHPHLHTPGGSIDVREFLSIPGM